MISQKFMRGREHFRDPDGKGAIGCLISIALLLAAIVIGVKFIPIYYAHSSFETDVKTEISRAGAHFYDDETVIKNVLGVAKRNEIRIGRENIKLERYAGQIEIEVQYSVPVDLFVLERNMEFKIKASSFVGTL